MSKQVNLLEGSIFGKLTKLAMPIMMTAFVQMGYNLVDMIWIGALGSGAFLTSLRRTRVGNVRVEDCLTLDAFPEWLAAQDIADNSPKGEQDI